MSKDLREYYGIMEPAKSLLLHHSYPHDVGKLLEYEQHGWHAANSQSGEFVRHYASGYAFTRVTDGPLDVIGERET
ncbi:MAG: hypothetical protein ABSA50_13050 [Candidatus Bathyarchaeia archaeon]|jgi:hypothetical protein